MLLRNVKKKKLSYVNVIFVCLLASVMLPVLAGCLYTMPCADDFANALGWMNESGNRLLYLFRNMARIYMGVQGTYFGNFLLGIPVYYLFGMTGLRLWIVFMATLFFVSCFLLVRAFTQLIDFRSEIRQMSVFLILTVGLFYLLGTNLLGEVFFWFTGVQVYLVPLCMLLLSVTCYLRYKLTSRVKFVVLGSVAAFLAAGGALNIASLLCAVYLFGILYDFIILKKSDKSIIMALVALAGALLNALAPGNFVRHTAYDTGLNLSGAFVKTVFRAGYAVFTDFRSGFLLAVVLITFLFGYKYLKNSTFQFRCPGLITLYALFAVFITDFPIVMGYASTRIGPRGEFVEHLAITMFFMLTALYWGAWSAKKELFEFTKTSILILTTMTLLFLTGEYAYDTFLTFTPYKMAYHIVNGDFGSVIEKEEEAIREIKESSERDVVIYIEPDRDELWVNFARSRFGYECVYDQDTAECQYFEKDSITIKNTN